MNGRDIERVSQREMQASLRQAADSRATRLWAIERRLLAYLDQRGPTHRANIVIDLASDECKVGWAKDRGRAPLRGSNGAAPLIVASWARRLTKWGWVRQVDSNQDFYRHHEITAQGDGAPQ